MNEIQTSNIEQLTLEINFYKQQTAQNIIEIGKRLIQAKEQLESRPETKGTWIGWLEREVEFSRQTANKYMRVAREFSDDASMRHLGTAKIFSLLSLPQEDREEFLEENPVENMTTRELREAIKAKKQAEQEKAQLEEKTRELEHATKLQKEMLDRKEEQISELKSKESEIKVVVEEKVVEKEVLPSDYEQLKSNQSKLEQKLTSLNRLIQDKDLELASARNQKEILERKAKLNDEESKKYRALKSEIENLSKEKDDLGRQIKARTELSGLVVRIEHVLKTELAPIKYSRAISEASTDEIVVNNLREIVGRVQEWCDDMHEYIPREYSYKNIIDAEVVEYE